MSLMSFGPKTVYFCHQKIHFGPKTLIDECYYYDKYAYKDSKVPKLIKNGLKIDKMYQKDLNFDFFLLKKISL